MTGILLQADLWAMVQKAQLVPLAVMAVLLGFSLLSFTIFFSKYGGLRKAQAANGNFLRAFRKAARLEVVAASAEQFRAAPLASVFDFGYTEVCRQVNARSTVTNLISLERSLQLGVSEEVGRLEKNMNWLATTAAVCPFIGLLGTVIGIIDAFSVLGNASGASSIQAVGPGISEALWTTALGLFAAIPAAIMYNYFGNATREMGQRMDDFSLEFLNLTERNFGDN
ncbi:MAG: MotA/TolQ/ExbB proton channel family protein [Acidobacteriota bacterium]